jgi:hypothetical protein
LLSYLSGFLMNVAASALGRLFLTEKALYSLTWIPKCCKRCLKQKKPLPKNRKRLHLRTLIIAMKRGDSC